MTLKCGLEVTQGHWKWYHLKLGYGFLFALQGLGSNTGRIFSHFRDIQCQRMAWPWNLGLGSFKIIENGAVRQTTYDFLSVRHCNYSSILCHFRVIRMLCFGISALTQPHNRFATRLLPCRWYTHTTLFTKAWQIQNIDISVRKEKNIYIQTINK